MIKKILLSAGMTTAFLISASSVSAAQPVNTAASCRQIQGTAVTQTQIAAVRSAIVEADYQSDLRRWTNQGASAQVLSDLEIMHSHLVEAWGGVQIAMYGVNGDSGLMGLNCSTVTTDTLLWNMNNLKSMGPGVEIVEDQLMAFELEHNLL